jgi:hypothetical protein
MKVFEKSENGSWGNRLNFVDANNVVLGYDYEGCCCENFYYYITKTEPVKFTEGYEEVETELMNNDKLYFDTTYNKDLQGEDSWNEDYATVFKVLGGEIDLFLVLVNCHNGYYGHGFDMKNSEGKTIFEGSL